MRIGFLGGDARMRVCAEGALRVHHSVASLAPFGVGISVPDTRALCSFCDVLVLPSPASRDGCLIAGTDIAFSSLPLDKRHAVFGGFIPNKWREKHPALYDCAEEESFLLKNAALTAEGGIATAMTASGRSFYGLSVGVIGYGRIAQILCTRLLGFGVRISVYARRAEALAHARLHGFDATPLQSDTVFSESILFNTVPEPVFAQTRVCGTLFAYDLGGGMESALSSLDGGTLSVVSMRGVPGVFAPTAAGEIILESLLAFIERNAGALPS